MKQTTTHSNYPKKIPAAAGSRPKLPGQPDDAELIERLRKGQEWAFNKLVNTYQERLLKIAYGITLDREESMEIVQDVFLSAHKHIGSFRQDASLATWLRKITVNHCLNWKRKWKRRFRWHHRPIESETEPSLLNETLKGQTPETLVREKQVEEQVMAAIQALPEKQRTVFVLSTFEGLSYQEISDLLKIKKGTVSSRLHSARTALLEKIEE